MASLTEPDLGAITNAQSHREAVLAHRDALRRGVSRAAADVARETTLRRMVGR